ncbi:MAG: tRNA pseudouridine(55) synthase TruB [Firmicutes bacterium]|nr:tRNA pseudouridine(55) synthase TruB [Bacillota bacterium]
MNGVLLINKEKGYTSRDVVNKVSKILGIKQIGHTGTLDPMATGVLVLCVGEATKLNEILTANYKEYEAEITLGVLTDTLDVTGTILKEECVNFSLEQILEALKCIKGKYIQETPIYSAVKVNGKKLYEYARNNEEVTLPKREVDIKEIELISDIKRIDDKVIFSIKCLVSKGTYIRTLAYDIAKILGTVGVMSKLNRTKQGRFGINACVTLDDIANGNYQLITIEDALIDYKKVQVDTYLEERIRNGSILQNRYGCPVLFVNSQNKALALYQPYDKDNTKIKPWKMFVN